MRKHILKYAVSSLAWILTPLLTAWLLLGLDTSAMGLHGWIAMILGILLTSGLAIGLMAATFASDASGFDSADSGRD